MAPEFHGGTAPLPRSKPVWLKKHSRRVWQATQCGECKEAIRIIKKGERKKKKNPDTSSVWFPICIARCSLTLPSGEVGVKYDFYGWEIGKRIIVGCMCRVPRGPSSKKKRKKRCHPTVWWGRETLSDAFFLCVEKEKKKIQLYRRDRCQSSLCLGLIHLFACDDNGIRFTYIFNFHLPRCINTTSYEARTRCRFSGLIPAVIQTRLNVR